jgi:hypothetical protein
VVVAVDGLRHHRRDDLDMTSILRATTPAFVQTGGTKSAGGTFSPAPAADKLVIAAFGGNKNSGTITPPTGFTAPTAAKYSGTSVSAAMAYSLTGQNGGPWTWTGQAEAVAVAFETDAVGATYRNAAQSTGSETAVSSVAGDAGANTNPGFAIAIVAVDSSTGAGGPFATAGTPAFTNGYTLYNRYQEATTGTPDAAGASFIVGIKNLVPGDLTTSTTASWAGGADQAEMIILAFDVPVIGQETGRQFISHGM